MMKYIVIVIGLTALAAALGALEVARLYRRVVCPNCGGAELSEFKPGLLTCRPCGHTFFR